MSLVLNTDIPAYKVISVVTVDIVNSI